MKVGQSTEHHHHHHHHHGTKLRIISFSFLFGNVHPVLCFYCVWFLRSRKILFRKKKLFLLVHQKANDCFYTPFNDTKYMPMTWAYSERMQGEVSPELAALQRRIWPSQSPRASDVPGKSPWWEIRQVWAGNQNVKSSDLWDAQLFLCFRGRRGYCGRRHTTAVELGAHLKTNLSQFYERFFFFLKYLILQIPQVWRFPPFPFLQYISQSKNSAFDCTSITRGFKMKR